MLPRYRASPYFINQLHLMSQRYDAIIKQQECWDYAGLMLKFKEEVVSIVYEEFDGNITHCADFLKVKRTTFMEMYRRINNEESKKRFPKRKVSKYDCQKDR